jgi:hypothetical protein
MNTELGDKGYKDLINNGIFGVRARHVTMAFSEFEQDMYECDLIVFEEIKQRKELYIYSSFVKN